MIDKVKLRNTIRDFMLVPRNTAEYCYIRPEDDIEFIMYMHEGICVCVKIQGPEVHGRIFDDMIDALIYVMEWSIGGKK